MKSHFWSDSKLCGPDKDFCISKHFWNYYYLRSFWKVFRFKKSWKISHRAELFENSRKFPIVQWRDRCHMRSLHFSFNVTICPNVVLQDITRIIESIQDLNVRLDINKWMTHKRFFMTQIQIHQKLQISQFSMSFVSLGIWLDSYAMIFNNINLGEKLSLLA